MENLIKLLVKSRQFSEESDCELYSIIIDKIYNDTVLISIIPFFYGFDDEAFLESIIMSFIESIFWHPINSKKMSLDQISLSIIKEFSIFLPHAKITYGNVINYLLYHHKSIFKDLIIQCSNLQELDRKKIAMILSQNDKRWFIYDDDNRVEREYQAIIDFCLE